MNWNPPKYSLIINPYESFMKKHLEHYGYFTGRNMTISRFGYEPRRSLKPEDSDESDTESDYSEKSASQRAKDKIDWKNKHNANKFGSSFKWWSKENNFLGLKDAEQQREPRWPIEMQVLPDKIEHIQAGPREPEPFYVKTGVEETPMCSGDGKGKTVYYYNPINCGYFIRSRVGGNREGCQKLCVDLPDIELESTLLFESRFESGNLMKAVKISDVEYELYLRYDLYTHRHTQWFYFQVRNAKPHVEYRFTICNFLKSDSLYNMGMKPVMYSEMDACTRSIGWRRFGSNIKYYRNNAKSEDDNGNSRALYSLTWTCSFDNANDTCYFAHCYPYTYSNLQDYIKQIQQDPVRSTYCKVKVMCRTLAENLVHVLTITSPSSAAASGVDDLQYHHQQQAAKKGVVLTARVHPGETNSSWMMKGFLDFLLSNSPDAKLMRDTFVFKIVPMLNPDGVIIGNYRCSLTGRDLNRNYKTLLKEAFPSIWHTREMVKKFMEERDVVLYCDLHGHSRKNNVFIYGCHNNNSPKRRFQEQVFPMMMSKNAKDQFSYKSCKFKIQKSKQGTGRIVMWNMGILNSFTMEATFSGSTLNQKAGCHFNTNDLEQLAYLFCDSLLDYCDPDQTKCKLIMNEVEQLVKEQMRAKLESQGINVDQLNMMEDLSSLSLNMDDDEHESSDDLGSDSSADDGLPLHLERFAKLRQRKKRKIKAKKTQTSNGNGNGNSSNNRNVTAKETATKLSLATVNSVQPHAIAPTTSSVAGSNIPTCSNNSNNSSSAAAACGSEPLPLGVSGSSKSSANIISEKEKRDKTAALSTSNLATAGTATTSNGSGKQTSAEATLLKETEKKLLRPLLANANSIQIQQIPQHPKSAKPVLNPATGSTPTNYERMIEERNMKRVGQNAIQLQLDMDSAQFQTDPNLLTFRYTLPTEISFPGNFQPHSQLCEHHRKKLGDLFLLKHLTTEERRGAESDGNASDDEAEPAEEVNEERFIISNFKIKPEPSAKKNESAHARRASRKAVSQSSTVAAAAAAAVASTMTTAKLSSAVYNEPILEIRNIPRDEALVDDVYAKAHRASAAATYEYNMPRYVLRQINERRLVGASSAFGSLSATASAVPITATMAPLPVGGNNSNAQAPFSLFNPNMAAKVVSIENLNDTLRPEVSSLATTSANAYKSQTRLSQRVLANKSLHQHQQQQQQSQIKHQYLPNQQQLVASSSSLLQQHQQQHQHQQQRSSSKLINYNMSDSIRMQNSSSANHTAANYCGRVVNDDYLTTTLSKISSSCYPNSIVNSNSSSNTAAAAAGPNATLFSSAFASMNPNSTLKAQYEKISTRATASVLPASSTTMRQKITK